MEITYHLLQQYRDVMTLEQLERYGEYQLRTTPSKPFSWHEIRLLQKKKQWVLNRLKLLLIKSDLKKAQRDVRESYHEANELMRTLQTKRRTLLFFQENQANLNTAA